MALEVLGPGERLPAALDGAGEAAVLIVLPAGQRATGSDHSQPEGSIPEEQPPRDADEATSPAQPPRSYTGCPHRRGPHLTYTQSFSKQTPQIPTVQVQTKHPTSPAPSAKQENKGLPWWYSD